MKEENAIYQHLILLHKSLLERAVEVQDIADTIQGYEQSERVINVTDGSRRDLLFIRDNINRLKREIDTIHEKYK